MTKKSLLCRECTDKNKRKNSVINDKVSKEELMKLVKEKSFLEVGKMFGVSDKSIVKWCKHYLIPFKKSYINNLSDEEFLKECSLSGTEYKEKYLK